MLKKMWKIRYLYSWISKRSNKFSYIIASIIINITEIKTRVIEFFNDIKIIIIEWFDMSNSYIWEIYFLNY